MTNSFARDPAAAAGALIAMATIPLLLLLTKTQSEQFAVVLLAVIGAIYIGFSLQKGQPRPDCDRVDGSPRDSLLPLWQAFGSLIGSFRLPGPRLEFGIVRAGLMLYPQSSSPSPYGTFHVAAASLAVMRGLRA